MSNARNHHYVSQVVIKKFLSKETNTYFLYDKNKNRSFNKRSPKSIFSLKDLNTLINKHGFIDYNSVEEELSKKFENQYILLRPYVAPPNIPKEKASELRRAFSEAAQDKDYIEEASKAGIDVNLIDWKEAQSIVEPILD